MAISNAPLVFVGTGGGRVRYKHYAAGGIPKTMELPAEEFRRRFLRHVVPSHFVRIRHFGLLANRACTDKRARCHQLLALTAAAVTSARPSGNGETAGAGAEPTALVLCPTCGVGRRPVIASLAPHRGHPP